MKKTKFFLLATITIILGCSKSDPQAISNPTKQKPVIAKASHAAIEKFKEERNLETSRQMYLGMSASERHQVWLDHFTDYKRNSNVSTDSRKMELIGDLEAALSTGIFENGVRNATDVFINYTLPKWTKKAEKVFSPIEIYDLMFENRVTEPVTEIGSVGSPIAECFCHVGNNGYSCKLVKAGIPSGLEIINGVCEFTVDCKSSRVGCGALWLSSCNGSHCNFG